MTDVNPNKAAAPLAKALAVAVCSFGIAFPWLSPSAPTWVSGLFLAAAIALAWTFWND